MASSRYWHDLKQRWRQPLRGAAAIACLSAAGGLAYFVYAGLVRSENAQVALSSVVTGASAVGVTADARISRPETSPLVVVLDRAPGLMFEPGARDPLPPPRITREERACLARAIHALARHDSLAAQIGVAQLVLNRVRSTRAGSGICEVVRNGGDLAAACGKPPCRIADGSVQEIGSLWQQASWIADDVAAGRAWLSELDTATHVHSDAATPAWRAGMIEVARIDRLVFYTNPAGPIVATPWRDDAAEVVIGATGREPLADLLPPAMLAPTRQAPIIDPRVQVTWAPAHGPVVVSGDAADDTAQRSRPVLSVARPEAATATRPPKGAASNPAPVPSSDPGALFDRAFNSSR